MRRALVVAAMIALAAAACARVERWDPASEVARRPWSRSSPADMPVVPPCSSACLDARGITEDLLAKGASRSSLEELTEWTLWADKVVTY